MASTDEEVISESETQHPNDATYIYPIAPKLKKEVVGEVDANTMPAFQCLDELITEGKIPGAKAARLKAKYQDLVDHLKRIREAESKYLHEGKELMQIVQKQRHDLERGEMFPSVEDNEVNRLRSVLLKHGNELTACNERLYQLDFKLEGLQEERRVVEKEFKKLPKKEEIEKQVKDNTQDVDDLKVEIAQRTHEIASLEEEGLSRQDQMEILSKEMEKLDMEEQLLKEELVKIHAEPAHLMKQTELIARQQRDVLNTHKQYENRIADVNNEISKISDKKAFFLDEKESVTNDIQKQRSAYEENEKEVSLLMKECDLAKERQAELLGDRTSLDLNIKHAHMNKRSEHDIHARKIREKDRDLKSLKKAEINLNIIKDGYNHTKGMYDKIKAQVDSQPKDDGSLFEKRRELQKEVDNAKRAYTQQNALTVHEKQRVERGIHDEEILLTEQSQLRIDVVDLTRLAQIKADEREQKARDYLKAEVRYHKALEDLKTKDLAIQDNTKKFAEVQKRLDDFAKLYDIIKNERNKCVNLIQMSTQKAAEMQEKIKILQNEIEILRTAAASKERQFQKSKLKHANSVVIRDSLRNEVSTQQMTSEELKEQMEQQRLAISKLNELINKAEENMVELRRRYESAVQERNRRGIQLIERNEEVCVLYEKVNVQGSIIRNGDMELQSREEEIRFLKMETADLKRSIDLLKSSLPNKKALDNELTTLQIQLAQCQEYIMDLEHNLEDATNADRIRLLPGNDPSMEELEWKCVELEKKLTYREEQLLEKELIHEQVNRLSEKLKARSDTGKTDTLALAKKINEVQAKIKETTRKMMAMVSELSMNQAVAMKLGQEIRSKEEHVQQCYVRMERGEAPSQEIEHEWLRYLREEVRRIKEQNERARAEEELEHYTIPGGITTTAEPRPNAYIPDDGNDLPLPRPYGGNAPFKPTEPGSNMRHIRKPVVKPIEI